MNNYQDYMPSLNPLQDTIRKLTDFTLPNRDLRDFRDRARREASTGVATQRAALQGTRQTLEQQRTQALNALQRNRALLPNWFQESLQQMSQRAQQQEAQRGVASSGLGLRNVLQAGQAPLQQHVQGLQNLIGQQGQVEGDFLNQLMSQVFRPERELALQEGSDATQRYMTYVNEAQQSLFEGRLQEAERLLNQAQLEYDALVKEAENRMLRERMSYQSGGIGQTRYTGGGKVDDWLREAIRITGVPESWLPHLRTIAMHESSGNPNAINDWDINAKRGTPSKGLMQTIEPTFNQYKMPGMNDIYNPVHNAVAAIRYIQSRYGDVTNVPGIKSLARGGPYRGY